MTILILLGILVILMLLGIPVAFSLGWASLGALFVKGGVPLLVFPQRLWAAVDSVSLLAILFFVVAGELMLQGGISKRLINFVKAFFGWMRGSLAIISILSCALFGALSGSALATTAAIGSIMYPEMIKDNKYSPSFSAALQAAGGTLGTMIPPSITLILYANITGASVSSLFIAVVIPGLLMACMYILAAYIKILSRGYDVKAKKREAEIENKSTGFFAAFKDGIWAIMMPVIVLGGIYAGIFTPTESAVVACVYAIFVGFFIYKELTLNLFFETVVKAAVTSSTIMILIATASFFGWVMAILKIPAMIMGALSAIMSSKFVFLLVINILFLICGMFMETSVIVLLVIPLVYPIASNLGVNLIHFGVVATINLSMGMITPPFGASLFVAANMTKQRVEPLYKESILYCLIGCVGILLVTYIEPLSMMLVSMMG